VTAPTAPPRSPLRAALLAVIGVGLLLLGGGLAVALGIGRDAGTPTSDSVDAGFARDMARHHQQGVLMANLAADHSHDPEVRRLAFDISATQTNQVGRMQGWLALWGLPPSIGTSMVWMGNDMADMPGMADMSGHTMSDTSLMPGMASQAELDHLRTLSGKPFDVEFLRLMIRHHQGGLAMAQFAAKHAAEPAVRRLAGTIAETQTAETTTMTQMLTARGGTPLPAP
jgi:uncharacterized protein (DUF305 family)